MATTQVTLPEKFELLKKGMRSRLVERNDEIEIFTLALLAKTHAFLLGEPGIAKSLLIETGIELIDGLTDEEYFHILFMKSTTREDVFGPLQLSLLKQDRYSYQTHGFLPTAKLVFGDEMWKANGGILNALLWATNERKYRNDGKVWDIPLHSMFIASNEMPENDELQAIYDRFPLRKAVKRVVEPGAFVNMLKVSGGAQAHQTPVISWREIEEAVAEVDNVTITEEVVVALSEVREELAELSIYPSDRRFVQSLKIIRAQAWLEGESETEVEHIRPLEHVLWSNPEDYPAVAKVMAGKRNPLDLEIMKIREDITKLRREGTKVAKDAGDTEHKARTGAQIFEKLDEAKKELRGIADRMGNSKRRSTEMNGAVDQIEDLVQFLLTNVFGTEQDEIAPEKVADWTEGIKSE